MSARTTVAIGAAALALFAVLPGAASATDYCVAPNTGCGGTDVGTFHKALDLADDAPDADRIFLGAVTYASPTTGGFDYSKAGAPVEIIGKGTGQTIVTAPSGASSALRLFGSSGNSVHDLRIDIPANVAADFAGLSTDGLAHRIDVTDTQPQLGSDRTGVHLENGGTLEDSSVTLNGIPTRGVWIDAGGGAVRGCTISAYFAVTSAYGATIERSRLVTSGGGVIAGRNVTTVENSVIALGQNGVALAANVQPGSQATINADGITILGLDHVNSRAVWATTAAAPAENATVNVRNSIIHGGIADAYATGAGHASVAISYSDHDPGGDDVTGANASITNSHTTNVGDPGFANQQLGDFHLLPASPLVDAGDPDTPAGRDMDGNPRLVDGNGDGTVRRDMGAFEYQTGMPDSGPAAPPPPAVDPGAGTTPTDTQAPVITGFRATTPISARTLRGTRFRFTLSEAANVTLRLQRRRPDGRYVLFGVLRRPAVQGVNHVRFTGRIGARALRPGRYRAMISATDAAGNRSAPRRATFRIARG
jgi:hypothetical protein